MLHILFVILKILGLVILGLLLLLLLTALLVLFAPVRYRVKAERDQQIAVHGRITWLARVLFLTMDFENSRLTYSLRIMGIRLMGNVPSGKRASGSKEETPDFSSDNRERREETKELGPEEVFEEEVFEEESFEEEPFEEKNLEEEPIQLREQEPQQYLSRDASKSGMESWDEKDGGEDRQENEKESAPRRNPLKILLGSIKMFARKIKNLLTNFSKSLEKIKNNLHRLQENVNRYLEVWHDEKTQGAFSHVKKEFFYLLKHIRPRKIKGDIVFGLENPADTGTVLGVACALSALTGNRLHVEADFENVRFEGEFSAAGHIRIYHFLKTAISLLLDRNIRITVSRIKKMIR